MNALIKKYWLKTIVSIITLLLTSFLTSQVTKIAYNKQIKALDTNISEMWQTIGDSKVREEKWKKSSEEHYAQAMEKEKKLRKKDQEMRVKIAEKRELKKKIREMPTTQVIVRTIEIIKCPDIIQQEQGVVFTLDCAKDNLTVLEDVFYFKEEALDWAGQFFTSQAEVADLKNVIIDMDKAYDERGVQLTDAYGIIDNWEGKFNLSEKRGRSNWWKGAKTGGIAGGIAGLILGFFLGK